MPSAIDTIFIFLPTVGLAILFGMVVPCALLCILQYFLSRLESPWPGRVLPILSGGSSILIFLLLLFNIAAVTGAQKTILAAFILLLVMNIPTAVFIVVYRVTRKHQIEKKNIDRMNIQDLE